MAQIFENNEARFFGAKFLGERNLVNGNIMRDQLGSQVAFAGDVNGDGLNDIVLTAGDFGKTAGSKSDDKGEGKAYVIYGQEGGFRITPTNGPDRASVNVLDAIAIGGGYTITGGQNEERLSVAEGGGDINDDGRDDVVVGAFLYDATNGVSNGRISVISRDTNNNANFTLGDPKNGLQVFEGNESGAELGIDATILGDINSDGYADVAFGAYGVSAGAGRTYVLFGSTDGLAQPDSLDHLIPEQGLIFDGPASGARLAIVSGLGDVNGDQIDDFVMGASYLGSNDPTLGEVYVVFGDKDSDIPTDLDDLDGDNGFKLTGGAAGEFAGLRVMSAGDVNGDDIDDILIAARNSASKDPGAYVIYG